MGVILLGFITFLLKIKNLNNFLYSGDEVKKINNNNIDINEIKKFCSDYNIFENPIGEDYLIKLKQFIGMKENKYIKEALINKAKDLIDGDKASKASDIVQDLIKEERKEVIIKIIIKGKMKIKIMILNKIRRQKKKI